MSRRRSVKRAQASGGGAPKGFRAPMGMSPGDVKKAQRQMGGMGMGGAGMGDMAPIEGVEEVVIKFADKWMVFDNPDVIELMGQYIVSGDAVEQWPGSESASRPRAASPAAASAVVDSEEVDAEEDDEPVELPPDVEIIVDQTGCTQKEALKALKDANGDLTEAILSLVS